MADDNRQRPLPRGISQEGFRELLPELLAARGMSVNALAKAVGANQSHFSRALRGADRQVFSVDLIRRSGKVLGLPVGYFPEEREALVIEQVRRDAALRDRLYRRISQNQSTASP